MKKFSIILPLFALIIGVAASAFTQSRIVIKKANANENFYRFMSTDPDDRLVESAYEYIGDVLPSPTGCSGSQLPCIIHAQGDETQPDFQASGISNLSQLALVTDAEKNQ